MSISTGKGFALLIDSGECNEPMSQRLSFYHYLRARLPIDFTGGCALKHGGHMSHGLRLGSKPADSKTVAPRMLSHTTFAQFR